MTILTIFRRKARTRRRHLEAEAERSSREFEAAQARIYWRLRLFKELMLRD